MATNRQICAECNIVVYEFNDGIATVREHKPTCSKRRSGEKKYFEVGDRVRRKKEYQDHWWRHGDKIFTVTHCGPKSPEFFMVERENLEEGEVNVHEWKKFEKVVNNE